MSLYKESKELSNIRRQYTDMLVKIVINNTTVSDMLIYDEWLGKWIKSTLYEILYLRKDCDTDINHYCKVKFITEFNCYKTHDKIVSYGKSDKDEQDR